MTRKLSKEELKDKLEDNELDLSLCNLVKVPVRELVSIGGYLQIFIFSFESREKAIFLNAMILTPNFK